MKTVKIILTIGILAGGILLIHSCKKEEKDYTVSSISLNMEKIELREGDTARLVCMVKPKQAKNKEVKWKSSDLSVVHVSKDGIVTGLGLGDAVITATSIDGNKKATCTVTVTNIIWADYNVAAPGFFTANVEDVGMFYQWNKKIGWTWDTVLNKPISSSGNTSWSRDVSSSLSWGVVNDPCPAGWRVPTEEELQTLMEKPYEYVTLANIRGINFDLGHKKIFLPLNGYIVNRDPDNPDPTYGSNTSWYWSNSASSAKRATVFVIQSDNSLSISDNVQKEDAHCIRCIKN